MIIGDPVDNVKGLPSWDVDKIGKDKLAYELLHDTKPDTWYKKVLGKYIKYYNTDDNPNGGLIKFMDNYTMLKLLTTDFKGGVRKQSDANRR